MAVEYAHVCRVLAAATVGTEISMTPFAMIAAGAVGMPLGPVQDSTAVNVNDSAQTHTSDLAPVQSTHSDHQHVSTSSEQSQRYQRLMRGVVQGHEENKTSSEVASIIRNALGPENVSESMAMAVLMSLIKKYAQKVVEN